MNGFFQEAYSKLFVSQLQMTASNTMIGIATRIAGLHGNFIIFNRFIKLSQLFQKLSLFYIGPGKSIITDQSKIISGQGFLIAVRLRVDFP